MEIRPSHVALLVRSVERSAEFLSQYGFNIGPAEKWEGEGTKEIYIEREKSNSLLLMESTQPGAYQRALQKRGPGLHHLAIDVLNLEEFLISISGSGWLLHPTSVQTIKKTKTAYLARPGFPALIEVQERKEFAPENPFVTKLELLAAEAQHLISAVGLEEVVRFTKSDPCIFLGPNQVSLSSLLSGKASQ